MPLVQAWKCPQTGKLFDDRSAYRKHLRKQVPVRQFRRRVADAQDILESMFVDLRRSASFDDISAWCVANWAEVVKLKMVIDGREKDYVRFVQSDSRLTSFVLERAKFNVSVSNTHHAPIGQPTNWWSKPDLPLGYPGWHGSVYLTYTQSPPMFTSNVLRDSGVNFGSGGGGETYYKSELYMFADDFPSLYVAEKLRGNI